MSNTNELHVIFGTGALGKATMRELVRLGKRVRMVNRSGKAADLAAGVEVMQGNAYSPASAAEVSQGAAVVYQCAQPAYHEWVEKFPPMQAAIMEGAVANDAKFIVGDNLYSYGDPDGRTISEAMPHQPTTKKGRIRAAMAEAVLTAHQAGKVRAAIGRASNYIGPEYELLGGLVFYPALGGEAAGLLGRLGVPHTFTYVPDFGRALATLGTHDEALGQVWIAPSLPAITQRELMDMLAQEIGQPVKARGAGRTLLRLMGLFDPAIRETVEMLYEWEKPYIVDSSKFERAFAMSATPIQQAVHETVNWFRTRKQALV